jgi:hypothetical protein
LVVAEENRRKDRMITLLGAILCNILDMLEP